MWAKRGKAHLCCSSRRLTELSAANLTLTFPPPLERVLANGQLLIGPLVVCWPARLPEKKRKKNTSQTLGGRGSDTLASEAMKAEADFSFQPNGSMKKKKRHKDAL